MNTFLKLASSIALSLCAGIIGSIFTTPGVKTWYPTLVTPSFKPPNWIFAPVWTTLYILMGIALYLVWSARVEAPGVKNRAIIVFFVQLALNALWSIVFFGAHSLIGGLIVIISLWAFILWNIILFYGINKTAGLLLTPYILWVSFATALNAAIWQLNK